MMRFLRRNTRGTTLVELLVCLALLGTFGAAAVALARPLSAWYDRARQLARAQSIADTIVEDLRGELLYAQGTLRLTEAAPGPDDAGLPFLASQMPEGTGTALEFRRGGAYLLLDAGFVPETLVPADDADTVQPARAAGYLHKRYYRVCYDAENGAKPYYVYCHRDATGVFYRADACTDAYAEAFYMGGVITLQFAVQDSFTDRSGVVRAASLAVDVTVARGDTGASLCTRRAVLDLPNQPILLQGTSQLPGRDSADF